MITTNRAHWDEGLPERDRENARRLTFWMAAWAISFLAAVVILGPFPGGLSGIPIWAWALTLLPVVPGIVALRLYIRYIRDGDELIRKIHVEAAVVGFGVASVMSIGFFLLGQLFGQWEDSGGITFVGMWLAYSVTLRRALRRYS